MTDIAGQTSVFQMSVVQFGQVLCCHRDIVFFCRAGGWWVFAFWVVGPFWCLYPVLIEHCGSHDQLLGASGNLVFRSDIISVHVFPKVHSLDSLVIPSAITIRYFFTVDHCHGSIFGILDMAHQILHTGLNGVQQVWHRYNCFIY